MEEMEIYQAKNKILKEECGKPVDPMTFYRELFPVGSFERKGIMEDQKANGILVNLSGEHSKRYTVTDDLDKIKENLGQELVLMGGCSYFGVHKSSRMGSFMYALVFDVDGVGERELHTIIHQMNQCFMPPATYIVNSGHGVHIYYFLEKPVPLYPQNQAALKKLKWALTDIIWNPLTSTEKSRQYQSIHQAFRMVGTQSKLGAEAPVVAYKFGIKTTIEELCGYWYDPKTNENYTDLKIEEKTPLKEAKEKWPDWYEKRIIKKQPKGRWQVNRALYDWWLRRIKHETKIGHRYFCCMILCIYAKKCGVPYEELEKDIFDLVPIFTNLGWDNPFTKEDAAAALTAYADSYITFPRKDIEVLSGIRIESNKRNGRKQDIHMKIVSQTRDILYPDKSWINKDGRPVGSGTKQKLVEDWVTAHPEGKKIDCQRETGLSRPTIIKWWPK